MYQAYECSLKMTAGRYGLHGSGADQICELEVL
jgi:hypothetical protein